MNPEQMERLAERVFDLLEEFEIENLGFAMSVRVAPTYFKEIKDNFPLEIPIRFGTIQTNETKNSIQLRQQSAEKNWSLTILFALPSNFSAKEK